MVGYLKRLGYQPIVLNWYPKDLEDYYLKNVPEEQIKCHADFTKEVFPLSPLLREEKDLVSYMDEAKFDGLIAGSDALFKYSPERGRWRIDRKRMRLSKSNPLSCLKLEGNPFFGGFLSKLKHRIPAIAYSVSSQNCHFSIMKNTEIRKMCSTLSNYIYITVRDDWTGKMVRKICQKKDIMVTPDPVFSFNQNSYLRIPSKEEICKRFDIPENYVLICFKGNFLSESYIRDLSVSLKKHNLDPVALPMPEGVVSSGNEFVINLPLTPLEWYSLIIHSKGYIGERMHPIVVCLHNAVPFFSFDYYGVKYRSLPTLRKKVKKESSKTFSILKEAGFTDNIYTYLSDESVPSAEMAVNSLLSFDSASCREFAQKKQTYFEESLNNALSMLNI